MGSTKCHLFNPGKMTPLALGQVDLSRQRDTEGWNYICAAFIPGTNIPTNETDIITVVDSSDDDNNSRASSLIARSRSGSAAAAASASRSSSSRATSHALSRNGSTQSAIVVVCRHRSGVEELRIRMHSILDQMGMRAHQDELLQEPRKDVKA
eukprot:scaffold14322_cov87-Skeletonema_dohrnii-CCMP3373.AAC.2